MKATVKGGILLFLTFAGIGYLGGLTGTVAVAPKYASGNEQKPAVVYNSGVQPGGQATTASTGSTAATGAVASTGSTGTLSAPAADQKPAQATTAGLDTTIFSNKGCIQCHTISGLNVTGGSTGPDLSNAINNVPHKYGKSLKEFLHAPEGIMSEVLPTKNVSDKEKDQIVELLTKAAAQQGAAQKNSNV